MPVQGGVAHACKSHEQPFSHPGPAKTTSMLFAIQATKIKVAEAEKEAKEAALLAARVQVNKGKGADLMAGYDQGAEDDIVFR